MIASLWNKKGFGQRKGIKKKKKEERPIQR